MTDAVETTPVKTPIWFWIVAVLAVLWNGFGVMDYVLTQTSPAYLESLTPEQLEFFTGFPAWFVALWATAVFLAFFASLALVFRLRWAELMFLISMGLYVISAVWNFGFQGAGAIMGTAGVIMSVFIGLTLVGFWWTARWGVRAGVLR